MVEFDLHVHCAKVWAFIYSHLSTIFERIFFYSVSISDFHSVIIQMRFQNILGAHPSRTHDFRSLFLHTAQPLHGKWIFTHGDKWSGKLFNISHTHRRRTDQSNQFDRVSWRIYLFFTNYFFLLCERVCVCVCYDWLECSKYILTLNVSKTNLEIDTIRYLMWFTYMYLSN